MAKRKLECNLVNRSEIAEELRLVPNSDSDYITPSGNVYADYGDGKLYPKKSFINNHNGYVYVNIKNKDGKQVQRRLHRILAEAYIPNPSGAQYVMHIDNNKKNYDLSNLKWGTPSENTQQAFDDGLIVNDRGYVDSQSVSVCMYDLFTTELVKKFGSISVASRETGVEKTTIKTSCDNRYQDVKKPYYFRYESDGNIDIPSCVGMYDMDTDKLLGMFINCSDASNSTGIRLSTVSTQVHKNVKPKYTKHKVYFLRINRN